VIKHGGQRDCREQRLAVRLEQDGQADAGDDDADIFDRRVREQPLHVGLDTREDDAEQRRNETQHQCRDAPPPELTVEQVERDTQQTVNRGLQHHAAHQRRNRRRCRRMRLREPDVHRQQARLRAEAKQREKATLGHAPVSTIERIDPERNRRYHPATHQSKEGSR
jgi:hypothetical protein